MLPGDVDGDGVVTVLDAVDVMNEIAASQPYSVWDDVVGDGVVDMNDYLAVRIRIGTKLRSLDRIPGEHLGDAGSSSVCALVTSMVRAKDSRPAFVFGGNQSPCSP